MDIYVSVIVKLMHSVIF